ncbi:hypothetical protein E2C01_017661 [Portunus trituberculatus]|uniref:Uncharacterized protein n=1 Tax=Portunus trituberculatus TaxID=210409 RepID=A0A5B7DUC1_PORTR|nr:hypothetical protein [Portunus trituberculatus]
MNNSLPWLTCRKTDILAVHREGREGVLLRDGLSTLLLRRGFVHTEQGKYTPASHKPWECSHRIRSFGTDATHTAHTDSKIAGQEIFLVIASTGHASWDSRLCTSFSRGIPFFDRNDLTSRVSLTHSLSFTVTLITPLPPPPLPPPPPPTPPPRQELSSQPASTTGNVLPSIAPGVNRSIATKVSLTFVRRVRRLRAFLLGHLRLCGFLYLPCFWRVSSCLSAIVRSGGTFVVKLLVPPEPLLVAHDPP